MVFINFLEEFFIRLVYHHLGLLFWIGNSVLRVLQALLPSLVEVLQLGSSAMAGEYLFILDDTGDIFGAVIHHICHLSDIL
jgi:hypothetical protein